MADKNQPLNVVENLVDKPYTVQRLVERPVERIVDKPVTLERVIERLVVDTVDKVVDKPAQVSRLVERPVVTVEDTIVDKPVKVSRTLVRQALNQLSRDRLVVLEPARGAFVASPSVEEARQVFEVRQILEAALTRRLCAVITDAQVAELRRHLQAEQAAVSNTDVSGRTHLLADFHVVLAQMLGNDVLGQMLGDLLTRSSLIGLMYQSSHSAEASVAEHVLIVDAFERRDVKAAVRLTIEHLEHVEQNLRLNPHETDLAQVLNPSSR